MELRAPMCDRRIDPHLLAACRAGDRDAFQRLYLLTKDRVYSLALYYFHGDAAAAEDVTQDVFLRLFTRLHLFHGEAGFRTWLYRLTANACVDELRRRKRFVPFENVADRADPGQPDLSDGYFRRHELAGAVGKALAELKPEFRIALLLRYFDDLSYEEMADVLGCSKGTVASRLNRGHKLLARKLAHLRDPLFPGDTE